MATPETSTQLTNADASSHNPPVMDTTPPPPPAGSGIVFENLHGGGEVGRDRGGPVSIQSTDDAFEGILKIAARDSAPAIITPVSPIAPIERHEEITHVNEDFDLHHLPPTADGVTSVTAGITPGLDPIATSHAHDTTSVVDRPEFDESRVGPKQRADWNKLKTHARNEEKRANTLEKQVQEAVKQISQLQTNFEQFSKLPQGFMDEFNRLKQLETVMAPEVCSWIRERFDVPLMGLDKRVENVLKPFNVTEEKMKQVRSPESSVVGNDKAGKPIYGMGGTFSNAGIAWLTSCADKLQEGGYAREAFIVRDAIQENWKIQMAKSEAIEQLKTNGDQMIQQQREAQTENQKQITSTILTHVTEMTKDLPYGMKIQITDSMTPQQKQYAAHANKIHDEVASAVADMVGNTTPDPKRGAHYIVRAALAPIVYRELTQLRIYVKELQTQLGKYKTAGGVSAAARSATVPAKPEEKKLFDERGSADAFDAFFTPATRQ